MINVGAQNPAAIMPYISSNRWNKLFHNAKFDTKFLLHYYKTITRNVTDTMLAEQVLHPEERSGASLEVVAKKYLDRDLNKSVRESFIKVKPMEAFTAEQLKYAAEDSEVLFGIWEEQKRLLEERGLSRIAQIEFDLSPVVGAMELTGIPVNQPQWRERIAEYAKEHEASVLTMNKILEDRTDLPKQEGMFFDRPLINYNSDKQLKLVLHKLGYDVNDVRERTISLISDPFATELLNYKGLQKLISSYGESILSKIHPFTNRLHPDFQQIGADTGRFSCRKPNVQQIPPRLRECVSDPDYDIVVADYSQIELRILAEMSQDPLLLEAFNSGQDLHKSTASVMLGVPIGEVTDEQRYMAKTLNFGICYGMQTNKLKDTLNAELTPSKRLTFKQADHLLNKYKDTYKKASSWLTAQGNKAYVRGYSETMLGRVRRYYKPNPNAENFKAIVEHIKRQGSNAPIQGTSADIIKIAMANLYYDLTTYGYRADIINQVHDEVVLLAHKSHSEDIKEVVEESLVNSGKEIIKSVPIVAEAQVLDSWKKK